MGLEWVCVFCVLEDFWLFLILAVLEMQAEENWEEEEE
jgi:hypothetical protein